MSFSQSAWSGRNTLHARSRGAERLSKAIDRARSLHPAAAIVLVGHSHGGSVIANHIKAQRESSDAVAGAVFLASPFYAGRIDRLAVYTVPVLIAALMLVALPLVASFVFCPLVVRVVGDQVGGYFPLLLGSLAGLGVPIIATLIGIVLLRFAVRPATFRIYRWIVRRVRTELRDFQTCAIPDGRYLFVRVAGDEVAAGMQVGLALMQLSRLSAYFLARAINKLASITDLRGLPIWKKLIAGLSLAAVTIVTLLGASIVLTVVSTNSPGWAIIYFATPLLWLLQTIAANGLSFESAFLVGVLGIVGFVYSLLLLALGLVVALLLGLAATAALGWLSPTTGLFTDLSVEPTPFGHEQFVNLSWDWRRGPLFKFGANHGRVYNDPGLANAIANWIIETRTASIP